MAYVNVHVDLEDIYDDLSKSKNVGMLISRLKIFLNRKIFLYL